MEARCPECSYVHRQRVDEAKCGIIKLCFENYTVTPRAGLKCHFQYSMVVCMVFRTLKL